MIVIRNVFRIRAGSMKQAVAQIQVGRPLLAKFGLKNPRALTDVTGTFYTIVLESECENLAEFEKQLATSFGSAEWQAWYKEFTPLIESGFREIFQVVG